MNDLLEYIDAKGRTWHPFTVSYTHEIDGQSFVFSIWAIDYADAVERLQYIRTNGKIDGRIVGYQDE